MRGASPRSRYRLEDGQPILDVRVESMEQLFDNRDPAPFRDRDLDPALVEYLLDGARDLASETPLRVEIWMRTSPSTDVPHAVRTYFQHEIDRTNRRRREQVRTGLTGLAIAMAVVMVLIVVAGIVERRLTGTFGTLLREALVISGWVLMWRPLDVLVYDRIAWLRNRRILESIRDAAIGVQAPHVGGFIARPS
jgi:hypothetical protein